MVAGILDGRKTAGEYTDGFRGRVADLRARYGGVPRLAVILVGDDPASLVYDRSKVRKAAEIGIQSELIRLPADTSERKLLALVGKLNDDRNTNGVLVQLPLPPGISERQVINAIDPAKDVDGLAAFNKGRLAIGDEAGLLPCTPLGIIRLLERYRVRIDGARAVVIGRSNIVGRPLSVMLLNRSATITTCHSKTKNLRGIAREADILVSAAGIPGLVKPGFVRPGAVVIDVAMNRDPKTGGLCGDVAPSVARVARLVSPVPGGVGPMTIAMLMGNTIRAFGLQNGLEIQI